MYHTTKQLVRDVRQTNTCVSDLREPHSWNSSEEGGRRKRIRKTFILKTKVSQYIRYTVNIFYVHGNIYKCHKNI